MISTSSIQYLSGRKLSTLAWKTYGLEAKPKASIKYRDYMLNAGTKQG